MINNYFLPEWAQGTTTDYCAVNAVLPTRDGRHIGNAVNLGLIGKIDINGEEFNVYSVITDAGTKIKLTLSEMKEFFHEPSYITKIPVVLEQKEINMTFTELPKSGKMIYGDIIDILENEGAIFKGPYENGVPETNGWQVDYWIDFSLYGKEYSLSGSMWYGDYKIVEDEPE